MNCISFFELGIISKEDVFDYEFSPYKEAFAKVYEFLFSILKHESYNYNLINSYFFFANNTTINAKACRYEDYNLISINSGLVVWLFEKININSNLKEYNKKYNEIFSKIQFFSFEDLSFQTNILFTFYHEFAHLLQQSDCFKLELDELSASDYSLKRHALELDADTFSGIFIARHLIQYFEKDFLEFGIEFLENVTIVLCSNLFFYLLSFGGANDKLYFNENSHPHPFIRVIHVLLTIGKYYEDNYMIKINKVEIVTNIVDEILMLQTAYDKNNLANFRKEMNNSTIQIYEYLQTLSEYQKLNIKSAVEIYNSKIKKHE